MFTSNTSSNKKEIRSSIPLIHSFMSVQTSFQVLPEKSQYGICGCVVLHTKHHTAILSHFIIYSKDSIEQVRLVPDVVLIHYIQQNGGLDDIEIHDYPKSCITRIEAFYNPLNPSSVVLTIVYQDGHNIKFVTGDTTKSFLYDLSTLQSIVLKQIKPDPNVFYATRKRIFDIPAQHIMDTCIITIEKRFCTMDIEKTEMTIKPFPYVIPHLTRNSIMNAMDIDSELFEKIMHVQPDLTRTATSTGPTSAITINDNRAPVVLDREHDGLMKKVSKKSSNDLFYDILQHGTILFIVLFVSSILLFIFILSRIWKMQCTFPNYFQPDQARSFHRSSSSTN